MLAKHPQHPAAPRSMILLLVLIKPAINQQYRIFSEEVMTTATPPDLTTIGIDSSAAPLSQAAEHICRRCASLLPDLSEVAVLIANIRCHSELRRALLATAQAQGHTALLLPTITPLPDFVADRALAGERRLLQTQERLLLLIKELRKYRRLYGEGDPWLLAANLLSLFDELNRHAVTLPASLTAFTETLSQAYRLPTDHTALQGEARLVHTLWQAWRTQLDADSLIDRGEHYIQQLNQTAESINGYQHLFLLGYNQLLGVEQQWLELIAKKIRITVFRQGCKSDHRYLPQLGLLSNIESKYDAFLNACYNTAQASLHQRIAEFKKDHPHSPAEGRLYILGVNQLEQHAQAIALFVRAALAEQAQTIGIVCEDRRLARRTRSLLERSDIYLHDSVGWALSTTRAAAIVESWLECIEQDFPQHAFLDVLKSPAFVNSDDTDQLNLIYRFEQDIVLHENIGSGLDRYRDALQSRRNRLINWPTQTFNALESLIDKFSEQSIAFAPLLAKPIAAYQLLTALLESLHLLDAQNYFQTDSAGQEVIQLLSRMLKAGQEQSLQIGWIEFRGWLKSELEQAYFVTQTPPRNNVILLNLSQSHLLQFDALLIAAADETHLSGGNNHLPFFNDSVRAALGLPDWRQHIRQREFLFRQLLSSSPSILITWQQEDNGEPIAASPWITALQQFHQQLYNSTLEPAALKTWLTQAELFPAVNDAMVPIAKTKPPAPTIAAQSVPTKLTAGAHQRLIDCPYRFYVHDVLRLKPADEIREALQKSDYGNRVHRCLEAFHIGVKGLPGPFQQQLTEQNRANAIELISSIAEQIFHHDIEDNFQHRGWLQRWLKFVPDYIDWQIKHNQQWQIQAGEKQNEVALDTDTVLYGRIDRVEAQNGKRQIIDYKTGSVPHRNEVLNGEDVQLSSYSLLLDHVDSVQYLGVDGSNGVNDRSHISGEELAQLRSAVQQRLQDLMHRIRHGEPLPANGDEVTCRYCDAAGICRRASWVITEEG